MARMHKLDWLPLFLFSLLSVVLIWMAPLAASALTSGEASRTAGALEELCDGSCDMLTDLAAGGDDEPFAFVLGLTAVGDGLNIKLKTKGSIYLIAPLTSAKPITLKSREDIQMGGESMGKRKLKLPPSNASVLAASAIDGLSKREAREQGRASRVKISREGDIYLDLSAVQVASLKLKARGAIVVVEAPASPVPEPTTGLLVGLGLAALSARRRGSLGS